MSLITRLEPETHERCTIWVDGAPWVTTDATLVLNERLAVGDELDEEMLSSLKTRADVELAKRKAFELLGYRDYCAAELTARLSERFDPTVAAAAVQRAVELGYVDDRKYAGMLARQLVLYKRMSVRRARYEMEQRHLDPELIEDSLSAFEDAEPERIGDLLQTKYARKLSDDKGRRSVANALLRLGYSYHDIRAAFAALELEQPEASE